jgi:hypothetical protein
VRHPLVEEWETRLRRVFERIDERLEREYGRKLPLHPARAPHGTTSSRAQDGLFNVGASFTAGFGSQRGPGYAVEVRMVTLSRVPQYLRERIEEQVAEFLREELPREFPGRELAVERDGAVFKIFGDLRV